MSQPTAKNSERNLSHKTENSERNLRHTQARIEYSKRRIKDYHLPYIVIVYHLSFIIIYHSSSSIIIIIIIIYYEDHPLCTQPYLYAYDPSHILSVFTIFGTTFPYSQPTLTRVCYSRMHITTLSSTLIPCLLPHISHSTLSPSCQPTLLCDPPHLSHPPG